MKPILFQIPLGGGEFLPVYPFFSTILVGALLAIWYLYFRAGRHGLSRVAAIDMGIIALIAAIVGTRIFHIVFEYPGYYWTGLQRFPHEWSTLLAAGFFSGEAWSHFIQQTRVFDFFAGGFVSLGAYFFTIGGWLLYFRWKKLPALAYFDQAALAVPIIIFFVRLGCLLTGCCYGRPTDFFLHLVFPPGSTAYHFHQGTPLHAVQVYFMLNAVVMFALLAWVDRRRFRFQGQLVATVMMYIGSTRFLLELLRGDADRGIYFEWLIPGYGLSTGQIFMALLAVTGWLIYRYGKRRVAHG